MATRDTILELEARMGQSIIGQEQIVERILIGLLANGNLLVEGLPGLAKTRAIKSLSKNLDAGLSRIQFTPDLLPSDITGTDVYHQVDGKGEFRFSARSHLRQPVLADEINRAPAKVQAALLEAMEERQVTVAGTTHKLPDLFLVMATQNPIEQEGTYPLPEAQMDRFLMQDPHRLSRRGLGGRDHPPRPERGGPEVRGRGRTLRADPPAGGLRRPGRDPRHPRLGGAGEVHRGPRRSPPATPGATRRT